jgi:peptide/nickel transport system substrate-binding protein
MKIVPRLATKWAISDDKKTWTFDLQPNVKFSDGSAFNPEAVKFSIKRTLDPKAGSVVRAVFETIFDQVEPVGSSQVKITTKAPYPDLLIVLASPTAGMYSPAATQKYDAKEYGRHPVGTGPYMLKEWTTGERVVLVPNPNYWGDKPKTPQITFRPVPEAASRAAMLRTGEADIAVKLPPEEFKNLQSMSNLNVLQLDSMYQVSYELNVAKDNPPLNDKRVRQALNYAVDKDAIAKNVLGGFGQAIRSPFGPGIDFRVEFDGYTYDPARAKQLLADAGYANGLKMELWSPQGRYLKDRETSEAVQGYLKAVGIDAGLRIWEWAPYLAAVREDASRQAMMLGRATPGADFFSTRLWTKGSIGQFNSTNYWTPDLEQLIPQARSTFDDQQRAQAYKQIQQTVWDDAPWLFLYNQKALVGLRKEVQGFAMWTHEVMLLRNVVKA